MCLAHNLDHPTKLPYNNSYLRFKFITLNQWLEPKLQGLFRTGYKYQLQDTPMRAFNLDNPWRDLGYHVYVDQIESSRWNSFNDAAYYDAYNRPLYIEAYMGGFNASGLFFERNCETWRDMLILKMTSVEFRDKVIWQRHNYDEFVKAANDGIPLTQDLIDKLMQGNRTQTHLVFPNLLPPHVFKSEEFPIQNGTVQPK